MTVSSQGIQFAIKNNFFDDVKSNYLPLLFDHIAHGYDIGSYVLGNSWTKINLTDSVLSIPNNDRQQFAKDFDVTAPKAGSSIFSLKMSDVTVNLDSNFTAQLLISKTKGHVKALMSKVEIDLEIELDTQEGFNKQMAPKVNINKINIGLDKKETKVEITGGVIPWMLSFIEGIFQSYLIDYVIKELESELQTTFVDDLNHLALKYLQNIYIGDQIGLDLSLNEKPTDLNGTFMIDLNGTFLLEDPKTMQRNYAADIGQKINLTDFEENMDTDVAFAIKIESIT